MLQRKTAFSAYLSCKWPNTNNAAATSVKHFKDSSLTTPISLHKLVFFWFSQPCWPVEFLSMAKTPQLPPLWNLWSHCFLTTPTSLLTMCPAYSFLCIHQTLLIKFKGKKHFLYIFVFSLSKILLYRVKTNKQTLVHLARHCGLQLIHTLEHKSQSVKRGLADEWMSKHHLRQKDCSYDFQLVSQYTESTV